MSFQNEKRLVFLSLTIMFIFVHFMVSTIIRADYTFPFAFLAIPLVGFLPAIISDPLFKWVRSFLMLIGHINSFILYALIYFVVLSPLRFLRKNRLHLKFDDSSPSAFQTESAKHFDFDKPY